MARRIFTARLLPVLGALALLAALPGCVAGGGHYGGGYAPRGYSGFQPSYRQSFYPSHRPSWGYSSGYAPRGHGGGHGRWHRGG